MDLKSEFPYRGFVNPVDSSISNGISHFIEIHKMHRNSNNKQILLWIFYTNNNCVVGFHHNWVYLSIKYSILKRPHYEKDQYINPE